MKVITKKVLNDMAKNYENDDVNKVARHALDNSSISNIVKDRKAKGAILNNFSINLETMGATNQKSSGRCWIFAGCNIIREIIAQKYNLEDFELSQNYIAFYDKLEKCNYILETIIKLKDRELDDRLLHHILQKGIEDGGQWNLFANIVNKYGLVPKNVMDETYQSSNTNEVNALLNRKLRQFASRVRKIDEDIESLKSLYIEDIYRILCDCFGQPPTKFNFEYTDKDNKYNIIKDLTPLEFYKDYTYFDVNEYVSIINSPTVDKPFYKVYTVEYIGNVIEGEEISYLNLPMKDFKKAVIEQMKDKTPVFFGSDCMKAFDRDWGIFDDNSFDYNNIFKTDFDMSKQEMLENYESTMNHAMVLTGVNLEEGIPTKWKIENSWGKDKGNKGYYVASDSWFDKFVYQAVINKKYLSNEAKKALSQEKVILDPWDPMGTLA